ncbi:MAG: hypothetical protein Kow0098_02670 [Ignavibacteriaceae bacterium]
MNRLTRIILLQTLSLFFISSVNAQVEAGKNYAGPALGISFLGSAMQIGGNYEFIVNLPETGNVGFGAVFRYWAYSEGFSGGSWQYTNFVIGGQANYHFELSEAPVNPWAGIIIAYNGGTVDYDGPGGGYPEPSQGGFWIALQGGTRYWIAPNIAITGRVAFGSLSYGLIEAGVDFKF